MQHAIAVSGSVISADCGSSDCLRPLRYSTFIHGLKLANIDLNRKSLSELAIHEPAVFDEIAALAKEAVSAPVSAAS